MSKKYSDFIGLNTNFKPVFSLENQDEALWKRFVFTSDFEKIVRNLSPVFQNNSNKKQGYILTGRYGVGKSHATSVLSHLLWDNFETIKDKLGDAKNEMGEAGHSLYYFREKSKLFPVILTQKNSINANTSRNFDLELQCALEKALEKHGFQESVQEKTDFEKYISWINELGSNPSKKIWIEYMNEHLPEISYFTNVSDLLKGLKDRDKQALEIVLELFHSLDLTPPQHADTREYYSKVLEGLKKVDPEISGIVIYWDEFTTVFNAAGRYNDTTLIGTIQSWAELASNDIFLFLVSHRSPEQFRGIYKELDPDLALINDRFYISDIKLDKITTYHLIASSLEISNEKYWKNFLEFNGFNLDLNYERYELRDKFGDLFDYLGPRDEKFIKRTIPFHPYSLYVASVLSDLIGSAERSIFELIYGEEYEEYNWGTKIGFSKYLELEPSESCISWYTIDKVFDYFFSSFSDGGNEYSNNPIVAKAINFFRQYFHLVKNLGTDHLKVFKAIVLMESLHAIRMEDNLIPSEANLKHAFHFTQILNLNTILLDLIDNSLIIAQEDKNGARIYKTPYSGMDERDIIARVTKIKPHHSFKKFIELNADDIKKAIVENSSLNDVCRIKNDHYHIMTISSDSVKSKEQELRNMGGNSDLEIAIIIPKINSDIPNTRSQLISISERNKNAIFLLCDGSYEKNYDRWLRAIATKDVAKEKQNTQMLKDSTDRLQAIVNDFTSELNKVFIIFKGKFETKTEGLNREINRCCDDIYNKGFDYLEYVVFWQSPKIYSKYILELYGRSNAKDLFAEKNSNEKKILSVLNSKIGDSFVNNRLELRNDEFVRESVFYEIVTKIRNYVSKQIGSKFSIRGMIQELELEKPPYGLCGWIESIIIVYALAPFYFESRLEVVNGNSTTSKECASIVTAVNDTIKKSTDIYLRYGSQDENILVSNLVRIFNLEESNKTLKEISFTIREKINSEGVPLWSIPYNYDSDHKEPISTFIDIVNVLIQYIAEEGNDYQILVSDLNGIISKFELEYGPTIWDNLFAGESLKNGFKSFVKFHNQRILLQYSDLEILIKDVAASINEDPWLWEPMKVIETLNSLAIENPPAQPQNLSVMFETDHVSLTWNPPEKDETVPSSYLIYRADEINSKQPIATVEGNVFSYKDKSISPGKKYTYAIAAKNFAGESLCSLIVEVLILPPPPTMNINATSGENLIELSWELPDSKYKILNFKVYRGPSSSKLTQITILAGETNSYQDISIEQNTEYYYAVTATNDSQEGPYGNCVSAVSKQKIKPPSKVKDFKANLTSEGVKLDWNFSDSEYNLVDEYLVIRENDSGECEQIASQKGESYIDKSVQIEKMYSYWIISKNSAGESEPSEKRAIKVLQKPPQLQLEIKRDSEKIVLDWDAINDSYEIIRYNIYRGESQNSIKLLDSKNHPSTSYEDSSITLGKTYYYSIVAINSSGTEGEMSNVKSYTVSKPTISVDINKWREDSRIVAENDLQLFINTHKNIINDILDEGGVSEENLKKIQFLMERNNGEIYE